MDTNPFKKSATFVYFMNQGKILFPVAFRDYDIQDTNC